MCAEASALAWASAEGAGGRDRRTMCDVWISDSRPKPGNLFSPMDHMRACWSARYCCCGPVVVCVCVCLSVCAWVFMYVNMYVCIYVCMYVCACMYIWMIYTHTHTHTHTDDASRAHNAKPPDALFGSKTEMLHHPHADQRACTSQPSQAVDS